MGCIRATLWKYTRHQLKKHRRVIGCSKVTRLRKELWSQRQDCVTSKVLPPCRPGHTHQNLSLPVPVPVPGPTPVAAALQRLQLQGLPWPALLPAAPSDAAGSPGSALPPGKPSSQTGGHVDCVNDNSQTGGNPHRQDVIGMPPTYPQEASAVGLGPGFRQRHLVSCAGSLASVCAGQVSLQSIQTGGHVILDEIVRSHCIIQ